MLVLGHRLVGHRLDELLAALYGGELDLLGLLRFRRLYPFGLLQVEDPVVAEKGLLHLLPGLLILDLDPFPEDHGSGFLALDDSAALLVDLVQGGPVGRGVAGDVQEEAVDSPVGPLGDQVLGQAPAGPGLVPGHGALFQQIKDALSNDLIGNVLFAIGHYFHLQVRDEPP